MYGALLFVMYVAGIAIGYNYTHICSQCHKDMELPKVCKKCKRK